MLTVPSQEHWAHHRLARNTCTTSICSFLFALTGKLYIRMQLVGGFWTSLPLCRSCWHPFQLLRFASCLHPCTPDATLPCLLWAFIAYCDTDNTCPTSSPWKKQVVCFGTVWPITCCTTPAISLLLTFKWWWPILFHSLSCRSIIGVIVNIFGSRVCRCSDHRCRGSFLLLMESNSEQTNSIKQGQSNGMIDWNGWSIRTIYRWYLSIWQKQILWFNRRMSFIQST